MLAEWSEWLILGAILIMGWALSKDIARAHTTLIALHDNALQPNSPLASLGSLNPRLPRATQFPEFVVPMLRQSR